MTVPGSSMSTRTTCLTSTGRLDPAGRPDGMPHIPAWSAAEHLALMDRLGIATSLLSISTPGVHLAATNAT